MEKLNYHLMNPLQKSIYNIQNFLYGLPTNSLNLLKAIINFIKDLTKKVYSEIISVFTIFISGNLDTKLSYLIMGFGCFRNKQFVRGFLYLFLQVAFFIYLFGFGIHYLSKFSTLGTSLQEEVWNEELGIYEYITGDNSMLILLYSVLTIFIICAFVVLWKKNIDNAKENEILKENGKPIPLFKDDLHNLVDKKFYVSLLTLPSLGVIAFTILPLIFMVLIAFTNYDRFHQPPGNLFTWVGFDNFNTMLFKDPLISSSFWRILGWTLSWAFFATFSNYILGMILAIMINKKDIKFKKFFRNVFVLTIAIPQFVSLMLMKNLLQDQGLVNVILNNLGLIDNFIPFLSRTNYARLTVILVNIWVGVPYTMLITTGILMNIPSDIYEAAKIDGAGPIKAFMKITLPYMLFVTGPYLITQFIGNINNFNVIFLLTGGAPLSLDYFQAGSTDLLVTWLYKMTTGENNYALASVIGIFVFIISAVFSLIVYNQSSAVKKEDEFK